VDELVVVGRVGELVDAFLRHLVPVGVADVGPGALAQSGNIGHQALGVRAGHLLLQKVEGRGRHAINAEQTVRPIRTDYGIEGAGNTDT
jgi:hypothetical protein